MNNSGSKAIKVDEYQMLRKELEDNVKKQDDLNNLIFTVLGISLVFNTLIENVLFLISVILVSAVLLSRIIHCRNTVYYLSAYLSTEEGLQGSHWEKRINQFKEKVVHKNNFSNKKYILINLIFKCAFVMKNSGNLILCSFVFIQILDLLHLSDDSQWIKIILFIMAVLSFLLNLIFTIVICIDKKVKTQYIDIWNSVIEDND